MSCLQESWFPGSYHKCWATTTIQGSSLLVWIHLLVRKVCEHSTVQRGLSARAPQAPRAEPLCPSHQLQLCCQTDFNDLHYNVTLPSCSFAPVHMQKILDSPFRALKFRPQTTTWHLPAVPVPGKKYSYFTVSLDNNRNWITEMWTSYKTSREVRHTLHRGQAGGKGSARQEERKEEERKFGEGQRK